MLAATGYGCLDGAHLLPHFRELLGNCDSDDFRSKLYESLCVLHFVSVQIHSGAWFCVS